MTSSAKYGAIGGIGGLVLGFLLGFVPEHSANADLHRELDSGNQEIKRVQNALGRTEVKLDLGTFAVRAAQMHSDAEKNDYSTASTEASNLFTDLRSYVDHSTSDEIKRPLEQVLETRDSTIAALAKADPAVKQRLQEIFEKLHGVDAEFTGSK